MWRSLLLLLLLPQTALATDATSDASLKLENRSCRIQFAPQTGELVEIRNVPLNDPILKGKPQAGTPFRLHADFAEEWHLKTDVETAAQVHLGPEGLTLRSATPQKTPDGEALELVYAGGGFECQLHVVLKADAGDSTWTLSIKNVGPTPRAILTEFPRLDGLQLGAAGAVNQQTILNQTGYLAEAWQKGSGGIYGHGGQWSMQWHAQFDPASRSALGLILLDPEIRNKRLVLQKPCLAVHDFPPQTLAPGETRTLPPARLMVYEGDWKPTARAYAAWYAEALPHATAPEWVRQCESLDGRHVRKRKSPDDKSSGGVFALESFRDLPAAVRPIPMDNTEYALWCRGSMLHAIHTDGDNLVREDLGGAEAMRAGFEGVRQLGLHSTLYIEGYIVYKESDLAKSGKAERWSVMHRDGSSNGPYTKQGFYHMCPGCVEWQDHLVSVVRRALGECGADGIRLDSLGFYFLPCYNPAHQHRSPFDYNEWMKQLLAKVRQAAVEINPNAMLTTEAPVDFYGQWFYGALTQKYADDVSPMRLAVAPYRPFAYMQAGIVWASLSGLAGGRTAWDCQLHPQEANWLAARHPVHDTLVWGEVVEPDPVASDPEIRTHRFRDERCEVIVAARPAVQKNPWPDQVALSSEHGRYELRIPAESAEPRPIALCDIESLTWQKLVPAVVDGHYVISSESNWLLAVIPRGETRVLAFEPLPPARPGTEITLTPQTLVGPPSGTLEVWAPGLEVVSVSTSARQPITLRVPHDARPGWYQVCLRGPQALEAKRYLQVVLP